MYKMYIGTVVYYPPYIAVIDLYFPASLMNLSCCSFNLLMAVSSIESNSYIIFKRNRLTVIKNIQISNYPNKWSNLF